MNRNLFLRGSSFFHGFLLVVMASSCGLSSGVYGDLSCLKKNNYLNSSINLLNNSVIIRESAVINMMGHSIQNGVIYCYGKVEFFGGTFENVSIISQQSIKINKCKIYNPKRRVFLYCPDETRDYAISVDIGGSSFKNIGTELSNDGSTVAAVYLQRVSNVDIEGCSFTNIGSFNISKVSAIIVGSSNVSEESPFINKNIVIKDSSFSNLMRKELFSHDSGEGHYISILASDNVLIKNNQIIDNYLKGYDSEVIYTKSNNVVISGNSIISECGGEGIIVCKPFQVGGRNYLTRSSILNNNIKGGAFATITHYGFGEIADNSIENAGTGFLISVQKCAGNYTKNDTLYIRRNTFVSTYDHQIRLYTGNCRSIFYSNSAKFDNQHIFVDFEHNSLVVNGSLSGCVFNLRNASNVSWLFSHNTIRILQKSIPFIYLQNDNGLPRINTILTLYGNKFYNASSIVCIPDSSTNAEDSLSITLEDNKASCIGISDLSINKSKMNHFRVFNNTLSD